MATVTVKPNQSMCDVILQACGSMEAGMQFCSDNGVGITDVPMVGTVYQVSAAAQALGSASVLTKAAQQGIVFGTLALKQTALKNNDGTPLLNNDGQSLFNNNN